MEVGIRESHSSEGKRISHARDGRSRSESRAEWGSSFIFARRFSGRDMAAGTDGPPGPLRAAECCFKRQGRYRGLPSTCG